MDNSTNSTPEFVEQVAALETLLHEVEATQEKVGGAKFVKHGLREGLTFMETLLRRMYSDSCEFPKADGHFCQNKGKKEAIQFCGLHKRHAADINFWRSLLVTQHEMAGKDIDTTASDLLEYMLDPSNRLLVIKNLEGCIEKTKEGLESETQALAAAEKTLAQETAKVSSAKAKLAKLKGRRESALFEQMATLKGK
jgi:hypothetical protein